MNHDAARAARSGRAVPVTALSVRRRQVRGSDGALTVPRGLMRKCACGKHAGGGPCPECARKPVAHPTIGEHDLGQAAHVESVVATPGQSLASDTRKTMEAGFGHDFSSVRVHTDAAAAGSAEAVDALAYTVGSHVVFGSGQYRPQTWQGQGLLAHELAHVVQQQAGGAGTTPVENPRLEHEADHAARRVQAGQPAGVARSGAAGMMRQPRGAGATALPKAVAPRAPTAAEQRIIEAARGAAAVRTQVAHFRTAGIGPDTPDNRPDIAGYERRQQALHLATKMFDWDPPNMQQVGEIVSKMITYLAPGANCQVAGRGDPQCGTRSGYVAGHQLPIVLCPGFFKESAEQRVRTLMHEAAHVVGIGNADVGESYCVVFDCEHGCGGFDSADSWAQYVHCLSGQSADKPEVIKGKSAAPVARPQGGKP